MGAINCLGLAKRVGARILQASTSEVYGDPEVHPQPEEYRGNANPIGLRACYDEGKRYAETLFFDYHQGEQGGHPGSPDLQYLWSPDACRRRKSRFQLYCSGLEGREPHRSMETVLKPVLFAMLTICSKE